MRPYLFQPRDKDARQRYMWMFTVTLSLGGRGYEREVTIALFEMDAGITGCREHFIMEEWDE